MMGIAAFKVVFLILLDLFIFFIASLLDMKNTIGQNIFMTILVGIINVLLINCQWWNSLC